MEQIAENLISLAEFLRLYEEEGPFEIIEGEVVPLSPQITRRGRLAGKLFRLLANHTEKHQLGEAFVEMPFVLVYDSKWVRKSRTPDLAVEVISPTDRMTKVTKKVDLYLRDGVRLVWLIDPEIPQVTVYRSDSNQQTRLGIEDTLSGEDVLPGFELPLSNLFEKK
jgi:Uma2 family endonuclease